MERVRYNSKKQRKVQSFRNNSKAMVDTGRSSVHNLCIVPWQITNMSTSRIEAVTIYPIYLSIFPNSPMAFVQRKAVLFIYQIPQNWKDMISLRFTVKENAVMQTYRIVRV